MTQPAAREFTVRSEGIFHGIPVLPHAKKDLRAIVVGASGTSGQPLIDVLAADPERWSLVYALSRKPPSGTRQNVKHIPIDLTWETGRMAAALKANKVEA